MRHKISYSVNRCDQKIFVNRQVIFKQLSRYMNIIGLGIVCTLFCFQTAQAQLSEIQTPQPTIEQSIDQFFGQIVGEMASVLLWDVAFWDNLDPLEVRSTIKGGRSLQDPLGWGLFTIHDQYIAFLDFDGQEQVRYSANGLNIDRAWLIHSGREILVKAKNGAIYFFQRVIKGDVKTALGPYRLPEGEWTTFAELKEQLIFGSSNGRLYRLDHKQGQELNDSSWSAPSYTLDEPITQIISRKDGAYWLLTGLEGTARVIKPLNQVKQDESFTVSELIQVSRPMTLKGPIIDSGFIDTYVWMACTDGLYTWNTKTNQQGFAIKLPQVTSVQPTFIQHQDKTQLIFITATSAGNHMISSTGTELSLKLSKAHPLVQKIDLMTQVDNAIWVNTAGQLHQISTKPTDRLALISSLKNAGKVQQLVSNGGHLIAQSSATATLWYKKDFQLPMIVLWLVFGAVFFTIRMRLVNLRLFGHAIAVVRGKYTDPNSIGEVSHFQALTSALSATVGLGNIAGVAIAVGLGGPGATFWMVVAGFLGMASKFTECTLGQKYRTISPSGEVMGGAMHYLSKGLQTERNLPRLGKLLAILFSFLCIGGSFGGGNAFQVKQSLEAVAEVVPMLSEAKWIYGLIMALAVGVVILGGIKSIAQTAEKIVPAMCGIYILASLYVILVNIDLVPQAFSEIIGGAFSPDALYGGAVGVLVVGFKRAAFSNEAGIGSAAIAHAAAKTEYPVREGVVALLEPFIDTIVVCTMTALVIVITGAYHNPEYGALVVGNKGAALTSQAMGEVISFFPYVLSVAVILFAYSTMISWSYYGERCWSWLFGEQAALFSMGKYASLIYKVIFLIFAFLGSIVTATNILDFSDLMILGMALPNILGLLFLTRGVRLDLDVYEEKLKAGEFPIFTPAPPVEVDSAEEQPTVAEPPPEE